MMVTREFDIDGLTFTLDLYGSTGGPAVLMLHGFGANRSMWSHLGQVLGAAGLLGVAPDQRGYSPGARPSTSTAFATERLLLDALELIDALGAKRFHVVGHDWGGQLAWLLAAHHSERIISMTAISRPHPAAFARAMANDPDQAERSRHHRSFRDQDAAKTMRTDGLASLRQRLLGQEVPADKVRTYVATLLEPGAIEGALNWYRGGSAYELSQTPSIPIPTLYIWGDADDTVGCVAAELTSDYVSGPLCFSAISGGSHFLVDQHPEHVTSLALAHIEHVSQSG